VAKNIDIKNLSRTQLRSLVNQISALGAADDTELAHITKEEMELLKNLGGSGHVDPDTGIQSFSRLSNWLYGQSRGKLTYKQYLDKSAGYGTYNKLSKMNLSVPKTYNELQDLFNRRGKFKGLKGIDTGNILGFLKFKEGGFGKTYKSAGDWSKSIGKSSNYVAGQLNPVQLLKEKIESSLKNIGKDRDIASGKANLELKTLSSAGTPAIGRNQDIWAKGAIAQKGIENVAGFEADKTQSSGETEVLGKFTELYG
tara:strand:- start:5235 stop:5999 length:765 start_codon:yes stop_codon:yes gene_type:complete